MKEFNNNQWDDKYPLQNTLKKTSIPKHYMCWKKMTQFMALSWSTNNNQNGMMS